MCSRRPDELSDCVLVGHGGAIRPPRGHCVIGVSHSDQTGAQFDLVTLQAVGIPATVMPFVMMAHYRCDNAKIIGGREKVSPTRRVLVHVDPLRLRERARLEQRIARKRQLANVVKPRRVEKCRALELRYLGHHKNHRADVARHSLGMLPKHGINISQLIGQCHRSRPVGSPRSSRNEVDRCVEADKPMLVSSMGNGPPEVESKYEWSIIVIRIPMLALAVVLLLAAPTVAVAQGNAGGGGKGGVLRLAGPVDLQTLDPAKAKDLGTLFLVRQLFAGLTRLDADLQPEPALAETIDISDDGLTYTFTLRRNARFADGRDITAEDVAFSLNRALDPATTGGDASQLAAPTFLSDIVGARELLSGVAESLSGVRVIDDLTLEIDLVEPRSTFLMRLATGPAAIIDRDDVERSDDWWSDPNSSGPFVIDDFDISSGMTLKPNENFYAGKPDLDEVQVLLGVNAFQPMNLYQTGEVDLAPVSAFSLDRALDPASDLYADLQQSDLFAVEYVAFRSDVEPLNDPNIRKALILGFPREKVASVSFDGRVAEANGFIPNGMLGQETWPVTGWDYDLDAARQAILDSSYGTAGNVPPITIYANGPPDRLIAFKEVIEADLGLQIDIVNVEWNEYISNLPRQTYPAYGIYWGADFPDPESLLLTLFGTNQPDNYVGYSNPEFDALLQQAASEQDSDTRILLYAQANQMLMDDAVVLPFFYDRSYMLVRPWVHGLELTPLGILYLDQVTVET